MRKINLSGSGTIQCLLCNSVIRYSNNMSSFCVCKNITTDKNVLTDLDGGHNYSIKPDFFIEIATKTVVVDFDDTLAKNRFPFFGVPNTNLINHLKSIIKQGFRVVVDSCRLNPDIVGGCEEVEWHKSLIRDFLDNNELWAVEILDRHKPYGFIYWDDKSANPLNKNLLCFLS